MGGRVGTDLLDGAKAMLACLEAIRASNPELIADNMPQGWGMNRVRTMVGSHDLAPMAREVERAQAVRGAADTAMTLDGDQVTERGVEAAEKAMEAHTVFLGIEGDSEVQFWHLMGSMLEWSVRNGVSIDSVLAQAKEELAA